MTLAALIRKREAGKPANDKVAKVAKDGQVGGEPLARLATLSLANPAMTRQEEAAIRTWLAHIGEYDPEIIAEVLDKCRADAGTLTYFVWRSGEVPADES